ncbi:MAG: NADH-quinone oxidoreductase subunit C [Fulvivirga sp.]|nr:NADH-quinone oxidoreductase subunit C [Fulvivirga sp.]
MTVEEIKALIATELPEAVAGLTENTTPAGLLIHAPHIMEVCELLYQHEKTYFDMLSCITGIDNGPDAETMEVVYHLCSIPYELQLTLKVELPRRNPKIHTVSEIWKTALWHERETFDLLGIHFEGHPDLRRILLPADWEGHPLRKDYEHQEYYRGIKIEY